MFKKLFQKKAAPEKQPSPSLQSNSHTTSADHAFMHALAEKKKQDPLIGPKIAGKEICNRLMTGMKNEKGVHIETLLAALGSLAGFSCQHVIREGLIKTGKMTAKQAFTEVQGNDGRVYYFGDVLNKPLLESDYSVWSLTCGIAKHLGAANLPDRSDIAGHVAKTIGGPEFGIPRIPDGHKPGDTPENLARSLWPVLFPILQKFTDAPNQWFIAYGFAIQEAILLGKDIIDPELAANIVMECAVITAKIDPLPNNGSSAYYPAKVH